MKVLFATKNPAKIKRFEEDLKKYDIELLSLKDISSNITVDESGKNAIENARIKAEAHYKETNYPTIAMDDTLYIDGIPEDKQPGTYVRRVNGKELNDEEMIEYYSNLAKEYGGKLTAKWIYGMVIYLSDNNVSEFTWSKDEFYIVNTPSEKRNPGYPLNSISLNKATNNYFVDMDDKFKNLDKYHQKVIEFIVNALKGYKK